jgi:GNAT superfamily N-acetyltransferase
MSRTPVTVRAAEPTDVPSLRELWSDILRKGGLDEQLADVARVVATAREREDQCVAVAEVDGEVAGAVYLEATTFTPLNLEPAVLAVSPHVFPQFRRKGVGSALMEVACRFADQHGITHVQTAAAAEARDANRFMARLSFTPQAMLRAATTSAVRARLPKSRQVTAQAATSRQRIDRVLAARRIRRGERVPG